MSETPHVRVWRVADNAFNRAVPGNREMIGKLYIGAAPSYIAVEEVTCRFVLLTAEANYYLDADGRVLARTNGPRGWNYSGKWRIVGFGRRWNSSEIVTLADAASGADIGHGFVYDRDHGALRQWASPSSCRAQTIRFATAQDAEDCYRMMGLTLAVAS